MAAAVDELEAEEGAQLLLPQDAARPHPAGQSLNRPLMAVATLLLLAAMMQLAMHRPAGSSSTQASLRRAALQLAATTGTDHEAAGDEESQEEDQQLVFPAVRTEQLAVQTSDQRRRSVQQQPPAPAKHKHPIVIAAGTAHCAKADIEDCSVSQCCVDVGHQCYEKVPGWGVCKPSCDQNRMREEDPEGEMWSCKPLGERRRCASATENCADFSCCATPGSRCFKRHDTEARCLETCDSEAQPGWSCATIGQRNFLSECTWAGGECSSTKCCNNEGFACVLKDASSAACMQTIKEDRWSSQKLPVPEHWNGKVIGEARRAEFEVKPAPEGKPVAGMSLFCLMVYLPNSTEEALMRVAEQNRAGIFGCNEHMTVHAWKSGNELSGSTNWDPATSTILNTDVFLHALSRVFQDGRFATHDWTVKADPDCVFFADRLRSHLKVLRPPPEMPIYFKNNDMEPGLGNKGFLGAIEVYSTDALHTYFANAQGCKKTLGTNCGEDAFFKACMDALGVGFMTDTSIFAPDANPNTCETSERAAFHPFRSVNEWQCCVDLVQGVPRKVELGQCDAGTDVQRAWLEHRRA